MTVRIQRSTLDVQRLLFALRFATEWKGSFAGKSTYHSALGPHRCILL
jgi:hypothetical protein